MNDDSERLRLDASVSTELYRQLRRSSDNGPMGLTFPVLVKRHDKSDQVVNLNWRCHAVYRLWRKSGINE
jgi:hypothetical protein